MDYYALKLQLHPNTEINRDVLSAVLADIGFESFVESEQGMDAFVPENRYSETAIVEVLENLPLPGMSAQYRVEVVKSRDWNEEWEKHFFEPMIIDNQVVIHSSFHKNLPRLPYTIVIDPKMAFGTGHHETTSLMISCLLENDLNGKSFLDMGCGTAVLAILAKLKNAGPVTAIDNDEWAYQNALENIRLNHTPDIRVCLGDAGRLGEDRYDVICANINRNILLNDISVYVPCMNPGASLFMSGFYTEDREMIRNECFKNQLDFVSYKEKNNWVAIHFVKQYS